MNLAQLNKKAKLQLQLGNESVRLIEQKTISLFRSNSKNKESMTLEYG